MKQEHSTVKQTIKGIILCALMLVMIYAVFAGFMFYIEACRQIEIQESNNDVLEVELLKLKKDISDLTLQNEYLHERIYEYSRILEEHKRSLNELDEKTNFLDRGGEKRPEKRTMRVTAYWVGSCGKAPEHPLYGITASGERVKEWYTIAAGPELPFGTVVYIPHFKDTPNGGYFVVKDRGGAIDNGDLDIYMTSAEECFRHGVKYLDVYILGKE